MADRRHDSSKFPCRRTICGGRLSTKASFKGRKSIKVSKPQLRLDDVTMLINLELKTKTWRKFLWSQLQIAGHFKKLLRGSFTSRVCMEAVVWLIWVRFLDGVMGKIDFYILWFWRVWQSRTCERWAQGAKFHRFRRKWRSSNQTRPRRTKKYRQAHMKAREV